MSTAEAEGDVLQHVAFASHVDVGMWADLATAKLHSMRLSSEPAAIWGCYGPSLISRNRASAASTVPMFCIERDALDPNGTVPVHQAVARGTVSVVNTLDEFKECNKTEFLRSSGLKILAAIDSGEAVADPSILSSFSMLVYSDLKAYAHYYWFNFPALSLPSAAKLKKDPTPLSRAFNQEQVRRLHEGYAGLSEANEAGPSSSSSKGFFIVLVNKSTAELSVHNLCHYERMSAVDREGVDCYFSLLDPSSLPCNPGWPLRNLLYLISRRWKLKDPSVICYRDTPDTQKDASASASLVLQISIGAAGDGEPLVTGWEANAKGKLGPRKVDLAPFLDPTKRAIESADLNLNLMKWRFLPELDTDRLANLKCLLLGSGTLGCNVARSLLSWGVRHVDFVDYGKVSFSNPTRQWLFEFEDCVDPDRPSEGRPKAQTASERLKRIVPNVKSTGTHLAIPMPGHPVAPESEDKVKSDVAVLESLVDSADVVFLLTDSRESRWLPSLMCAAKNKPCINVALGFDTFVVMRHGVPDPSQPSGGCNVGCYFCNDVVAPTDSSKNRTLDQQCTTTRPGLSAIASALAVELLVSVLHHPKGPLAPAELASQVGEDTESQLGIVPHQIRGFLANFSNVLIHGNAFDACTACSPKVVSAFKEGGWSFLKRCFNEPDFLESLSGLKAIKDATDAAMDDLDWDEDEDDDDM